MYRKIGSVRIVMICVCIVGGMATYNYLAKNKVSLIIMIENRH